MDRRAFLLTAGAGAAAGVLPTTATASPPPLPGGVLDRSLHQRAERLRRRRDRVAARTLRRLGAEEGDDTWLTYARATGAMAAIDRLASVPVRDQIHPAVQGLLGELAQDVADGLLVLQDLFEAVADGDEDPTPDELAEIMTRTAAGLDEEIELSEASRRLQRNGIVALHQELTEEGLRTRLRREARRIRRLHALSARIAEADRDTAVLTPADPTVRAQVEEGESTWVEPGAERTSPTTLQVLGIIACGLGIIVGGFLVIMGISCAVTCDAPGTLLIALLAAIIGACIVGIRAIVRAIRRKREPLVEP